MRIFFKCIYGASYDYVLYRTYHQSDTDNILSSEYPTFSAISTCRVYSIINLIMVMFRHSQHSVNVNVNLARARTVDVNSRLWCDSILPDMSTHLLETSAQITSVVLHSFKKNIASEHNPALY